MAVELVTAWYDMLRLLGLPSDAIFEDVKDRLWCEPRFCLL